MEHCHGNIIRCRLQQLSEQFTALSLEEARTIFTKEVRVRGYRVSLLPWLPCTLLGQVLAVQQQEREATEEQARIGTCMVCVCVCDVMVCGVMCVWCDGVMVCGVSAFQQSATSKSTVAMDTEWSNTETQLLIKAVVVYPAGTQKRWEVSPPQATRDPTL